VEGCWGLAVRLCLQLLQEGVVVYELAEVDGHVDSIYVLSLLEARVCANLFGGLSNTGVCRMGLHPNFGGVFTVGAMINS
jgi:hypothetical protein